MPAEQENRFELDLGEPPPEITDYARTVLGEDPDTKTKLINDLRDMIYERGECIPHRMDDAFLLRFLRARYFIVERAHRLIVNYYQFKEDQPEIHKDVEPLKLNHIGEADVLSIPPYTDQHGHRIMIYRIGNWVPADYPVDDIFKATIVTLELGMLEPKTQIMGGVAIFDFENLSMQHAWQVTPSVASKVIQIMVTSFPMKIDAIHIVNQSRVFDVIFSVFRPLLDEKMRAKIFFHGYNMESLHKHMSPKHLPVKYGGIREEFPYTVWLDSLKTNPKIVKEMKSLGYKFDPKEVCCDD